MFRTHHSARGQNVILRVLCPHKTILEKRDNLVKIRLEVSGRVVKNFQKKLQLVGKKRRLTFVSVVIKTLKNIPKIYGGFENFIEFDCWMPTFFSSYISVINTIDCDEKLENVKLINPNYFYFNIYLYLTIFVLSVSRALFLYLYHIVLSCIINTLRLFYRRKL